jgi:hypothetical protein
MIAVIQADKLDGYHGSYPVREHAMMENPIGRGPA